MKLSRDLLLRGRRKREESGLEVYKSGEAIAKLFKGTRKRRAMVHSREIVEREERGGWGEVGERMQQRSDAEAGCDEGRGSDWLFFSLSLIERSVFEAKTPDGGTVASLVSMIERKRERKKENKRVKRERIKERSQTANTDTYTLKTYTYTYTE